MPWSRRWLGAVAAASVAVLWFSYAAPTVAAELWLTPEGAGGVVWGARERPAKYKRKPRSVRLADDGFAGRGQADAPDDIELEVWDSQGERRFMRYVDGALVDAWLLRPGPIDDSHYLTHGVEQFRGAIVGPAEPGWVAIGDAISWEVGGRTVLHWRDRLTNTEVLASRAIPGTRYSARRPEPLRPGDESSAKMGISGDLKKLVKPFAGSLSKCFDSAIKPIRADVGLKYDRLGRLARVKVDTDSVTYDVERCVAAALVRTGAAPGLEGSFSVYRHN
jgi:hypothetical protein